VNAKQSDDKSKSASYGGAIFWFHYPPSDAIGFLVGLDDAIVLLLSIYDYPFVVSLIPLGVECMM
jgi:hypothetical protein